MSGTYCTFDATEAQARCRKFIEAGGNMAPVFKAFGEYMILETDERFTGQHAPDGTKWLDVEEQYWAQKKTKKILTESSRLRESIIYTADAKHVAYGTNVVYAAIHQFGGQTAPHVIRPKNKKALFWPGAAHPVKLVNHPGSSISARPFLGITDENVKEFYETLKDHMEG